MGKYLLITVGFSKPTEEDMQKWMAWFGSIGDKMESQVGLMNGREVSKEGDIKDLPFDLEAQTGYLIINAESIDEATEIAKACPAVTSTRVYEIRSH